MVNRILAIAWCLMAMSWLAGCSGKPAGESSTEIFEALPDPPKLEDCGDLLQTLDWKLVQPGELKTGGARVAISSFLDGHAMVSSHSAGFNVRGTIKITRPFTITDEGIPAKLYCEFLNDTANPATYLNPEFIPPTGPFGWGSLPDWVLPAIRFDESTGTYYLVEGREDLTIIKATFEGTAAFCEWISQKTGCAVRLPTEAEWMLAGEQLNWNFRRRGLRSTDANYWVLDYYSPDISYLVQEDNPLGPRLGEGSFGYSWTHPDRLSRSLPSAGGNPRIDWPDHGAASHAGIRLVLGAWPEDWKIHAPLPR